MEDLELELSRCDNPGDRLIVTDGVFSMKGTVADLPGIKKLADRFDAAIMVDDAHGTGAVGATGRGTLEYFGMEGQIDLVCGTFSKSLGTIGGFTASSREVVDYLKLRSRPFIFSASPPPASMATVLACLDVIEEEPELMGVLREKTDFLRNGLSEAGFTLEPTLTPIIPVLIGDEEKTFLMAGGLQEEGVIVNPVVSPAVPKEGSLIRISVMATIGPEELQKTLDKFVLVGTRLGVI
jgi:7-keto-8-aminopelargonate synthetase-like enzyme